MPELVAGLTPPPLALDVTAGFVVLLAGLAAWRSRPQSLAGRWLTLAGGLWLAGDAWSVLLYAHRGPLVHALLTYPSGRTRSRVVGVIVTVAYFDGLIPAVARSAWPTLALAVVVVVAAAWRWAMARGLERRQRTVPLIGAAAIGAAFAVAAVGDLAGGHAQAFASWLYAASVAATAVALAADLMTARAISSAATGLVIDLATGEEPSALRDALARAVGDPALAIAYRIGDDWLDEAGRRMRLPSGDSESRLTTVVEDEGRPVAALVHDPAALRDEALSRSVAAAVRLALANVRLQAEVAGRVRDVAASRRRLVEASDVERRRLSEQLRAGAERRLALVARDLQDLRAGRDGDVAAMIMSLTNELAATRADLADFARGVHPQTLTEHGLSAALAELASRAGVPVELDVTDDRFPAAQEAAAFYVCSEALTNVAKYASASTARVGVNADRDRLVVRVSDDGAGGAQAAGGSGLRGLADRVEALGGTFAVHSPRCSGTRVTAVLPLMTVVAR